MYERIIASVTLVSLLTPSGSPLRRPKYSAENSAHGDFELSDPSEEVYNKYIHPTAGEEPESSITCPKCDSTEVDRGAGYRGEYKCMNCGHFWRRT